jgi:hypothetical protein
MHLRAAGLALLFLVTLTGATGDGLPPEAYQRIRALIEAGAGYSQPGATLPITGGGLSGEIRLRTTRSRQTGEPCGACLDPCRSFTFFVSSPAGDGSYRGDTCLQGAGRWQVVRVQADSWTPKTVIAEAPPSAPDPVPTQVGRTEPSRQPARQAIAVAPSPPSPSPRSVTRPAGSADPLVVEGLQRLRYLPAGEPSEAAMAAALQSFARDYRLTYSSASAPSLWRAPVAAALARTASGSCPASAKGAFVMCGRMAKTAG